MRYSGQFTLAASQCSALHARKQGKVKLRGRGRNGEGRRTQECKGEDAGKGTVKGNTRASFCASAMPAGMQMERRMLE